MSQGLALLQVPMLFGLHRLFFNPFSYNYCSPWHSWHTQCPDNLQEGNRRWARDGAARFRGGRPDESRRDWHHGRGGGCADPQLVPFPWGGDWRNSGSYPQYNDPHCIVKGSIAFSFFAALRRMQDKLTRSGDSWVGNGWGGRGGMKKECIPGQSLWYYISI